jgi:hypothetical protein
VVMTTDSASGSPAPSKISSLCIRHSSSPAAVSTSDSQRLIRHRQPAPPLNNLKVRRAVFFLTAGDFSHRLSHLERHCWQPGVARWLIKPPALLSQTSVGFPHYAIGSAALGDGFTV